MTAIAKQNNPWKIAEQWPGKSFIQFALTILETHRLPGALGMVWDLWRTNDMGHGGICMGNSNLTFSYTFGERRIRYGERQGCSGNGEIT